MSGHSPLYNAGNVEAQLPQVKEQCLTPKTSRSSAFLGVVIPPTSSQHSEYRSYPELDASIEQGTHSSSRKRKRGSAEPVGSPLGNLSIALDQRKQGQNVVIEFQSLLDDYGEAEGRDDNEENLDDTQPRFELFVQDSRAEDRRMLLAPDNLLRLDKSMTDVVNARRLADISLDHLLQTQRMCFNWLESSLAVEPALPEDHDEDVIDSWNSGMEAIRCGLRASKLLLRTLQSGKEEKQLYSESIITTLLTCLKRPLESCVIPFIESRGDSTYKEFCDKHSASQRLLSNMMPQLGQVLKLLGEVLLKVDLSENSTNVLIFLASQLIFVESAGSEKDALLGMQRFEGLRRHAMDTLANIFLRYPVQRNEIFDELLSRLEKLPIKRQTAKNFKIADGKPVQLISALILQLVHTVASGEPESKTLRSFLNDDADEGVSSTFSSPTKKSSCAKSRRRGPSSRSGALSATKSVVGTANGCCATTRLLCCQFSHSASHIH